MIIPSRPLTDLVLAAFSRHITWLEAAQRHPLADVIETFQATRQKMHATLADLTDADAAFVSPEHDAWSISETVTHLIYSQGFYANKLLDLSTSQMPHVAEAARGFGEGAKAHIPAEDLRRQLTVATQTIDQVFAETRYTHNPQQVEDHPFFGLCNYAAWTLLMLGHEMDHVRQATLMRRLARGQSNP